MIANPSTPLRTSLKPYPGVKDSGVSWLGKVPEHWEIRKLRHLLRRQTDRNRPDLPLLSVVREKGVILRDITSADENHNFIPDDLSNYKVVRVGQFAMNKMKAWQGSYGVSRHDGIVSPAYFVFNLAGLAGDFFHSVIRSSVYVPAFTRASDGVRIGQWDLAESRMREIQFAVPPLSEQAAIVRFLDHYDRKIRRYIRAKQKLIKLLEEEKQAIIHRAVTRGLDPNVRLKPSGVEWLGDIPEHWEVVTLRHRYSQCLGKMLDSKRITGSHSLPYLRNIDVQWDRIKIDNLPTMDIPQTEYDRYTLQKGDLLVCEGGEVGRSAIWSGELAVCGFQKALHRLRPRNPDRDVARFMYYSLRTAAKGNAFNDGHLSTIAHLTGDKLRAHRFPFPPVTEQEDLVNFLDSVLKQADQTISTTQHEISLLREYHTRLIADVVTGKLDVREASTHLPAKPEDPEQLEEIEDLVEGEEETEEDDMTLPTEEASIAE
ncbi:MAG: restriction modification system DNA specificity domain-containing protein [Nitrospirales bacterium]|nr:MAG: restriction modification system DNA specificity domain-containing protein [Nitrospirales bacterium]